MPAIGSRPEESVAGIAKVAKALEVLSTGDDANLKNNVDAILSDVVSNRPGLPRVPGAVAVAVDRSGEIYAGAAGERVLGSGAAIDPDTVLSIYSCTKALTATAALQLWEEGLLDLDVPASTYVPELASIPVLDGRDPETGAPRFRAPKVAITTRHLLTHTAGFSYDFFTAEARDLNPERGAPSAFTGDRASLERQFLLFEPGEQWLYGTNLDWVGLVIEAIRGQDLETVFQERIFGPLGMTSSSFSPSTEQRARLARIHARAPAPPQGDSQGRNSAVAAGSGLEGFTLHPLLPSKPEVYMGGHGVHASARDYAKFLRAWLNDGQGDHGRILKKETIDYASQRHLPEGQELVVLNDAIPAYTNPAQFFPGLPASWAISFYRNEERAPTGRTAGSVGWAGLPNLFYWIDREAGVAGFWGTQVFPFADPTSFSGYAAFETAVYDARKA